MEAGDGELPEAHVAADDEDVVDLVEADLDGFLAYCEAGGAVEAMGLAMAEDEICLTLWALRLPEALRRAIVSLFLLSNERTIVEADAVVGLLVGGQNPDDRANGLAESSCLLVLLRPLRQRTLKVLYVLQDPVSISILRGLHVRLQRELQELLYKALGIDRNQRLLLLTWLPLAGLLLQLLINLIHAGQHGLEAWRQAHEDVGNRGHM